MLRLAEIFFIELLVEKEVLIQLGIALGIGVAKGTEQGAHKLQFVSFQMGHKE